MLPRPGRLLWRSGEGGILRRQVEGPILGGADGEESPKRWGSAWYLDKCEAMAWCIVSKHLVPLLVLLDVYP